MNTDKDKRELKELAASGCSRCGGRGHVGYNETTGRYVACKCVRQRLRLEKREATPVVQDVVRREQDLASSNQAHLQRLEQEIGRLAGELSANEDQRRTLEGRTPEEEALENEQKVSEQLLQAALDKTNGMRESADRQTASAGVLEQQAADLEKEARRLRSMARATMLEARAIDEDAIRSAADQKEALDRALAKLIAGQRRRIHYLTKVHRETQRRKEKLEERAQRVRKDIDSSLTLVSQLGSQNHFMESTQTCQESQRD